MENASKALLMAAGMLIGMLVLSLAIYLFTSFSGTAMQISEENVKQQIDQFNSQFTSLEGKNNITIYDVISIANLATENNIYYEFPTRLALTDGKTDNYISVVLKNTDIGINGQTIESGTDGKVKYDYNELIRRDLANMGRETDEEGNEYQNQALTTYRCETRISPETRKSLLSNFYQKIKKT